MSFSILIVLQGLELVWFESADLIKHPQAYHSDEEKYIKRYCSETWLLHSLLCFFLKQVSTFF